MCIEGLNTVILSGLVQGTVVVVRESDSHGISRRYHFMGLLSTLQCLLSC